MLLLLWPKCTGNVEIGCDGAIAHGIQAVAIPFGMNGIDGSCIAVVTHAGDLGQFGLVEFSVCQDGTDGGVCMFFKGDAVLHGKEGFFTACPEAYRHH